MTTAIVVKDLETDCIISTSQSRLNILWKTATYQNKQTKKLSHHFKVLWQTI